MSRIACAFSCQADFLKKIDQRARSLGMTRSQYIVQVLRQDLLTGNPNLSVISEHADGGYETGERVGRHKKKAGKT